MMIETEDTETNSNETKKKHKLRTQPTETHAKNGKK